MPRLVYIRSPRCSGVMCEQLKRHDVEDWRQYAARTSATRGLADAALNRFRRNNRHTLQHDRLRGRHIRRDRGEERQHGTHSDHGQQARTYCRRGRFGAGEDLASAAHGVLHSVLKNIESLRWSELYSSANTLCRGTRRIAGEARELQIRGATGRDARWHCLVRRRVNFGTRKVPNFRVRLGAKRNNSELL